MPNDRYVPMSEARVFLGNRSRSAIYTDIAAGRLPKPVRLGGRVYFRFSTLEAAMTEAAMKGTRP